MTALRRKLLDVDPSTRARIIAVDIKDPVAVGINYIEGNHPKSMVSGLEMGIGQDDLPVVWIRHRSQSPPLPWVAVVLVCVDPAYVIWLALDVINST